MIQSKDYNYYIKENNDFINKLKNKESVLYLRLNDVIKVLGYIVKLEEKDGHVEEELETIFESGFSYIHEHLEIIKLYYERFFESNIDKLLEYQMIINYLLYLDDLSEVLEEKGLYNKKVKHEFDTFVQKLEDIIKTKKSFNPNDLDEFNTIIDSFIPQNENILTTDYIFTLILEEIGG